MDFDLEGARQGKPVCTKQGNDVRIVCWDMDLERYGKKFPIVGLETVPDSPKKGMHEEVARIYTEEGVCIVGDDSMNLRMKSVKHEGWINVYPEAISCVYNYRTSFIYNTKEEALEARSKNCIDTVKIEWEDKR